MVLRYEQLLQERAALLERVAALQAENTRLKQCEAELAECRAREEQRHAFLYENVEPFQSMIHAIGWSLLHSNCISDVLLSLVLQALGGAAGVTPPSVHDIKNITMAIPRREITIAGCTMAWVSWRVSSCF